MKPIPAGRLNAKPGMMKTNPSNPSRVVKAVKMGMDDYRNIMNIFKIYRENEWMKNLKIYSKMDKKRLDDVV